MSEWVGYVTLDVLCLIQRYVFNHDDFVSLLCMMDGKKRATFLKRVKRPDFTYKIDKNPSTNREDALHWKGRYTHGVFDYCTGLRVETYGDSPYYKNIMVVQTGQDFLFEHVHHEIPLETWMSDVNTVGDYIISNKGTKPTTKFTKTLSTFKKLYITNIKHECLIAEEHCRGYKWDHATSVFMFAHYNYNQGGFTCILLEHPDVCNDIYREYAKIRDLSSSIYATYCDAQQNSHAMAFESPRRSPRSCFIPSICNIQ